MTNSRNILFVCTGNTCRSPLAEGLFLYLNKHNPEWNVASAGISAIDGDYTSKETVIILQRIHLDFTQHKSQAIRDDLIEDATDIFVMTQAHLAILFANYPEHADKIHLVTEYSSKEDVPDPIGYNQDAYEKVADILFKANCEIIRHLIQDTPVDWEYPTV